ncbi:MAG: Spore germination protein KA [Thermoanaerobacterales bacterium 50_218]|nr:MAG: Spore germination protein KA [Thermoanaerobacterales bacterium 50_218]
MEKVQPQTAVLEEPFSADIETNVRKFQRIFGNTGDLSRRDFLLEGEQGVEVVLFYIDGLVDKGAISEVVLKPFLFHNLDEEEKRLLPGNAYQLIKTSLITSAEVKEAEKFSELVDLVLVGHVAVFVEGSEKVLAVDVKGWKDRGVEEPESEAFIRGPREGFTETLRTNTALIRRRIKTPNLEFNTITVGEYTKTDVCVVYIRGLTNPDIVREVESRIRRIKTDGILESGYLEDFIEDDYKTPFVLVDRTERPDKVAAGLLEGKVAILVDGTPFALIVPVVFGEILQSAEDYYEGNDYIRPIRWIALLVALFLPSFYVALTTFHQEMIPPGLALSMAAGREGVPVPAAVEAFMMEITFDFLREAGIRMPRPVGQAIGILGAVVIGQAAVAAGVVSPIMVIVVSLTAICSFLIPNYSASVAIRFLRYIMLLLGGVLGLVGVFWGMMMLLLHLASLRSFGIPYLYPVAPMVSRELRDIFVRTPWWTMDERPRLLRTSDQRRQAPGQRPRPPQSGRRRKSGEDQDEY